MRKVYITLFFLVFGLSIYGSGISGSEEYSRSLTRVKRVVLSSVLNVTSKDTDDIVTFADTGLISARNSTKKKYGRIKNLKNKIPFGKKYSKKLSGMEKRKPLMKRVKEKLPFRKKLATDYKLEVNPSVEFQGDVGILTNDRIGETEFPRAPIATRIKNFGNILTLRRRTGGKGDSKEYAPAAFDIETATNPTEDSTETSTDSLLDLLTDVMDLIDTETIDTTSSISDINPTYTSPVPDILTETILPKEFAKTESIPSLPESNLSVTKNTTGLTPDVATTSVKDQGLKNTHSPKISTELTPDYITAETSHGKNQGLAKQSLDTISNVASVSPPAFAAVTKQPLLTRVKSLSKKIPLRRKPQIQSKSDSIELEADGKGVDEYRLARLNVWWVRNYVVAENSKPAAYFDEETIAVIGFDGTVNATTCRLLEPVLKEEKEKALEDLSLAGVELKPVTLDVMLDMIAGCKTEGVADDKWTAWTLLNGILPGTKWCGRGDVARAYEELGPEADIDRCCRAHDHCPVKIKPFKRKFGLTNLSLYTKSHCECDDEFDMCLRATKNPFADILGNFYFNVLRVQCMEEQKNVSFERCGGDSDCDYSKFAKMRFRDPRKFIKKYPA